MEQKLFQTYFRHIEIAVSGIQARARQDALTIEQAERIGREVNKLLDQLNFIDDEQLRRMTFADDDLSKLVCNRLGKTGINNLLDLKCFFEEGKKINIIRSFGIKCVVELVNFVDSREAGWIFDKYLEFRKLRNRIRLGT